MGIEATPVDVCQDKATGERRVFAQAGVPAQRGIED